MTLRVAHVITGLGVGGAEMMLAKVIEASASERYEHAVLALRGGGLRNRIAAAACSLREMELAAGRVTPGAVARLVATLREWRPHVIQGWMYHGNFAAALGGLACGLRSPIVWNIRHSLHDIGAEKPLTRLVIRMNAAISRLPRAIVYNSEVSARQHELFGYEGARARIIPNGFDVQAFRPDREARARFCSAFGITPGAMIIGCIARAHPMKDHGNLIAAAGRLVAAGTEAWLVMAGSGAEPANRELALAIGRAGMASRTTLLGERHDIHAILPGCDVAVLCSAWGEAFPNALGEAMACGIPCVATDVGDCRKLLGEEAGIVVPPRDVAALTAALERLAALGPGGRRSVGAAGRARVGERFALPVVARQYEALYEPLADPASRGPASGPGNRRPVSRKPKLGGSISALRSGRASISSRSP